MFVLQPSIRFFPKISWCTLIAGCQKFVHYIRMFVMYRMFYFERYCACFLLIQIIVPRSIEFINKMDLREILENGAFYFECKARRFQAFLFI